MDVVVFGAAGPTGLWVCREALAAGHRVRAVSRRADPLPLPADEKLTVVRADVGIREQVQDAVEGAEAVLSVLGAPYVRREITVYSAGTRAIVEAMRSVGRGRRLVVCSSGLTYPPPPMHPIADRVVFPILRNVVGRTLYADMRRMEEFVRACDDLDWTIMRPGRLVDADAVSDYRVDLDHPSRGVTTRADLAAATVAELGPAAHVRAAVAPTSR